MICAGSRYLFGKCCDLFCLNIVFVAHYCEKMAGISSPVNKHLQNVRITGLQPGARVRTPGHFSYGARVWAVRCTEVQGWLVGPIGSGWLVGSQAKKYAMDWNHLISRFIATLMVTVHRVNHSPLSVIYSLSMAVGRKPN